MTTPPGWTPGPQWSDGAGPYRTDGAELPTPKRNSTAAIGAIVAATVVIVAALAVYAFSGHRPTATGAGPSTTTTSLSGLSRTTSPTPTPAPTSAATRASVPATTSKAPETPTTPTASKTPKTSKTSKAPATHSTGSPNTFSTCTNATANLDLINLTVALAYTTSYASADDYNRNLIDSCTTAAVRIKLNPYYGKVFGTSFTDLTGNNDMGPTDRYHVPLVNTSEHVTFILKRKDTGPGFRVVGVMA